MIGTIISIVSYEVACGFRETDLRGGNPHRISKFSVGWEAVDWRQMMRDPKIIGNPKTSEFDGWIR
jgi:hypothetical protein